MRAIVVLDKIIAKDAHQSQAWLLRAEAQDKMGKYDNALSDYTQYVTFKPDDSDCFIKMASCYTKLKKYNVAVSCLSKALLSKPKDIALYRARADAYDKLGEHAQAKNDRDVANVLSSASR